jgi:hypothetical protein
MDGGLDLPGGLAAAGTRNRQEPTRPTSLGWTLPDRERVTAPGRATPGDPAEAPTEPTNPPKLSAAVIFGMFGTSTAMAMRTAEALV